MAEGASGKIELYRRPAFAAAFFLIAAFLPLFFKVLTIPSDPRAVFLTSQGQADWIHIQRPFEVKARWGNETITYRKRFRLERAAPGAVLTVKAMRTAAVRVDDLLVLLFSPDLTTWKAARSVPVGTAMTPGEHEITVQVFNENGPALLLVSSPDIGLFTGEDWEASEEGGQWRSAMPAFKTKSLVLPFQPQTTLGALASLAPLYAPLFGIVFWLAARPLRIKGPARAWLADVPSAVRWLLIVLWSLLAANNIMKIKLDLGYDALAHYDYIVYVTETWKVPLASQGWQMFQSPLYYYISAVLNAFFSLFFTKTTVGYLLRIVPLGCGILQVELSYRAARYAFPERKDFQIIGTVLGGLLPMSVYISHYAGNEPLAGLLSAAVLVLSINLLRKKGPPSTRQWILLGTLLGLALLTKVTAVLLVLPLGLLIYTLGVARDGQQAGVTRPLVLVFSTALIISGWYYLRNWLVLGRPFVGGWESSPWWQDPGYRTFHDVLSFGTALWTPFYSGIHGFWDSMYSTFWSDGFLSSADLSEELPPAWNYRFMLSGILLSVLPAVAILVGMVRAFVRPARSIQNGTLLSAVSVLFYAVVLLSLYLSLPIYSTAKATYTLGLVPCYALLCLYGLEPVMKNKYSRAFVYAVFACWAVSAYASFFIVS